MDAKSSFSPHDNQNDPNAVFGYISRQHPHPGHGPLGPRPGGPHGFLSSGGGVNFTKLPRHAECVPERNLVLVRVVMCLMVFLIIMTTIVVLLVHVLLASHYPIFQLVSFSVPSFNITDSSVAGRWETAVTVVNPTENIDTLLEHIDVSVVYADVTMAIRPLHPFELKRNDKVPLSAELLSPATGTVDVIPDNDKWLRGLKGVHDGGNKTVPFDLVFNVVAMTRSGEKWNRRLIFRVFCEDLRVEFKDSKHPSVGVWNRVDSKGCEVVAGSHP